MKEKKNTHRKRNFQEYKLIVSMSLGMSNINKNYKPKWKRSRSLFAIPEIPLIISSFLIDPLFWLSVYLNIPIVRLANGFYKESDNIYTWW